MIQFALLFLWLTIHIMRLKNISLLLLIFILGITGCDDEPEKPQVGLPDSLTVQIESSANDPSIVNVTAKANAVNFFTITFLDGDNTESIETPYGTATHTYTKSGLYEINVKNTCIQKKFFM